MQLKDNYNILKFASLWNVENANSLLQSNDMQQLVTNLKDYLNIILTFNISKKEIISSGKSNIYLNIKNIYIN